MLPGLESWRGRAWIARDVVRPAGVLSRLVFEGVGHCCDVYWNGVPVGRHEDAYTPFEVMLPPDGTGRLALRVDNTFGAHAALHYSNDYYSHGGITRPVTMEHVPPVFLSRLWATPCRESGEWHLGIRIALAGRAGDPARCRIRLGDRVLYEGRPDGAAGKFPAGGVGEWTPGHPALYDLTAELLDASGAVVDDLIERVGFREVRVEGDRILLNGRPLSLRGFNRHEDHSIFGSAIPPAGMAHDLALLRELGANFVRTAHYPNDRRFLDLCDETGMLVWEESHARQIDFAHPRAKEQSLTSTREMLDWHHNHPSIILWGCLNECDTRTPGGVAFHAEIIGLIRQTDPSRPVTYAGYHHEADRAMHLVDVVSHNMYPGWYSGGPESVGPHLEKFLAHVDSAESGGAGKPVIISEFGAGAIGGFRAPPMVKLTEDYQDALLREGLEIFLSHPRLSGLCLWQFADCRVCEEGNWWMHRPRCLNDKGVLTRSRRRKLAFNTVRKAFHTATKSPVEKAPVSR
jgi:beta-glucuronidase